MRTIALAALLALSTGPAFAQVATGTIQQSNQSIQNQLQGMQRSEQQHFDASRSRIRQDSRPAGPITGRTTHPSGCPSTSVGCR